MKKILTIATLTMAMTTVPLTAHAETVDEANQATQTAYQAYQQAEAEKTQAWNDSHGDVYSDAWQTADTKSKALYNAYLDARQHAGLVSAEAKRNSSNSSASETQDLTGDSASKASNDSNTKSDMPTTDPTKATQTADSNTKSATPTNDNDTTKAIQTAESNPQSEAVVRQPAAASKTSKTLPQTGNDIKNKTMLTLIGSGVMGIATAAMIILIRERHHD